MGTTPLAKLSSYPSGCTCIDDYEEEVNVYPEYYQREPNITPEDLAAVRKSWRKIIDGSSENYQSIICNEGCKHENGADWFGEAFYLSFFEAHPAAQYLFSSNMVGQIKKFTRKLSELLDMMERPNDIHMTLMDLAVKHAKHGVHAIQYGIFGRVLLNTLKSCLLEEYTDYVNQSWIKVYSFILSVVVPIALAEDRQQLWSSFPRVSVAAAISSASLQSQISTMKSLTNESNNNHSAVTNGQNGNHSNNSSVKVDETTTIGTKDTATSGLSDDNLLLHNTSESHHIKSRRKTK